MTDYAKIKLRTQEPHSRPIYYLDMQGVMFRHGTHPVPAGWTPPSELIALQSLEFNSIALPKESIKPADPISRVGGLDFRLRDDHAGRLVGLFAFYSANGNSTYLTQQVNRDPPVGGPFTYTVESTAAFPVAGVLYVGHEAWKYTGKGAAQFTGVTREHYRSQQKVYRYDAALTRGMMVSDHPTVWRDRKVKLYRNWLKEDGAGFDAAYGGDHEELLYTGRIVELKQSSYKQRIFTVMTNPILADLNKKICGHLAHTEIPDHDGLDGDGIWLEGIDRFVLQIHDRANDNTRTLDYSVGDDLGGWPDRYGRELVAAQINVKILSFLNDGDWAGRPDGKLPGSCRLTKAEANEDREGDYWEIAGSQFANASFRVTFVASPHSYMDSIGPAYGFTSTVEHVGGNNVEDAFGNGIYKDVAVAQREFPRQFVSPRQTRLYVWDGSEFKASQGTFPDTSRAFLVLKSGDSESMFVVDGLNVLGAKGQHYFITDQEAMIDDGVWPFQERIHTPQALQKSWHFRSGEDPPITVKQVLVFRRFGFSKAIRYMLMSSGSPQWNDTTYDAIRLRDCGLDLEYTDVDLESFDAAIGFQNRLEFRFLVDKPIRVSDWLKAELTASGCFVTQKRGAISLQSWAQAAALVGVNVPKVHQDLQLDQIGQRAGLTVGLNTIEWSFGHNPMDEDNEWQEKSIIVQNKAQVDAHGTRVLKLPLPAHWLRFNRAEAIQFITNLSTPLLSLLGRPLPVLTVLASRRASDIWVGDLVEVTTDGIWNPKTGVYGYVATVFQVIARDFNVERGHVKLEMITMDGRGYRIGVYAPEAKITAWDAGAKRLTVQANAFSQITNRAGAVQVDSDFFKRVLDTLAPGTDMKARVFRQFDGATSSDVLVDSIVGNVITLFAAPAFAPIAGDRLRLRIWDDAEAKAQEYAFQADGGGVLGAGGDAGFHWAMVGGRL